MRDLKGKHLLKGESDGSSYPNGGLRAPRTAGGYLSIDPTSSIWLRDETIFVPSVFVSYHGYKLDKKTPLMRVTQPMPIQGTRLPKLIGYDTTGIHANIGLEQELLLAPCDAHMKRPGVQMAGRTYRQRCSSWPRDARSLHGTALHLQPQSRTQLYA